jgi:membrane protein DedA with SNARE-associated domain/membrane-associated phospholipid phosphatase
MIGHLGELIARYGYLVVGLFILGEGIAIPFPTDTTLVTASAFAAHGRLSIVVIFLISTFAAAAGTTVAFVAGRRGGDFFERHARKVNPAVLARTRSFFDRHGGSAIIAGRFIPVARMLISPMAGLSTMSFTRFSIFNLIGAALWSAVFCGVGYFFGQHPPAFGHGLARGALIVAVGLALVVTVLVAGGWLVEESDAAWRAEGTLWHRILTTAPLRWLAAHSPRARAFLFRRFSPGGYLGLNLTIGLGLSFVTLVIFGVTMDALLASDAVPQFDLQLAAALRETATPARDAFWGVVSRISAGPGLAVPALLIGVLLAARRKWLFLIGAVAAAGGALLLDLAVKRFFLHTHTAATAHAAAELGAPSAQALGAVVGYGMIAYFLVLHAPSRRTATLVVCAAVALVIAICFGRLYLGTRFFSDVVSGVAAGSVWLCACLTGLEVARRRAERERLTFREAGTDRR